MCIEATSLALRVRHNATVMSACEGGQLSKKVRTRDLSSHRCPEVLWQNHSLVFLIESPYNFPCSSRSSASVVFIYFAHQTESLRTRCHLMAVSSPAGPQVAKYTLLLFVWPACSILARSPSAEWPLILLWEGSMKSRRAKRHLAGISHLG